MNTSSPHRKSLKAMIVKPRLSFSDNPGKTSTVSFGIFHFFPMSTPSLQTASAITETVASHSFDPSEAGISTHSSVRNTSVSMTTRVCGFIFKDSGPELLIFILPRARARVVGS